MTKEEKVRENRYRRAADRQGLVLSKSARRDKRATDYGTYHLLDQAGNVIAFCANLDEVQDILEGND